jgi:hypothetical protein
MQLQFIDALGDGGAGSRQETRAHAVGHLAQPQIEASGLNLVGNERIGRQDGARFRQCRDHAVRQNAFVFNGEGKRHGCGPSRPSTV